MHVKVRTCVAGGFVPRPAQIDRSPQVRTFDQPAHGSSQYCENEKITVRHPKWRGGSVVRTPRSDGEEHSDLYQSYEESIEKDRQQVAVVQLHWKHLRLQICVMTEGAFEFVADNRPGSIKGPEVHRC